MIFINRLFVFFLHTMQLKTLYIKSIYQIKTSYSTPTYDKSSTPSNPAHLLSSNLSIFNINLSTLIESICRLCLTLRMLLIEGNKDDGSYFFICYINVIPISFARSLFLSHISISDIFYFLHSDIPMISTSILFPTNA